MPTVSTSTDTGGFQSRGGAAKEKGVRGGGVAVEGTALGLKQPVLAQSRPSDFIASGSTPRLQSAHLTTATGQPPTMRVNEVKPAPGSKMRSRIQLLKEFTRAPTSELTTSSLHLSDSHKGAAEAHTAAVAEEREAARQMREDYAYSQQEMLQNQQALSRKETQRQFFDPHNEGDTANPNSNLPTSQGERDYLLSRTVQNLVEQRDLLQNEVNRLVNQSDDNTNSLVRRMNKATPSSGVGMPTGTRGPGIDLSTVPPLGEERAPPSSYPHTKTTPFVYGAAHQQPYPQGQNAGSQLLPLHHNHDNPSYTYSSSPRVGQHSGSASARSSRLVYGSSPETAGPASAFAAETMRPLTPAMAAVLSPLNVNTAAPGTGGLVPKESLVKAARREESAAGGRVFVPQNNAANGPPISALQAAVEAAQSGAVPLGLQPPLHAPYGAFCSATNNGGACGHRHSHTRPLIGVNPREHEEVFDHLNGIGAHTKLKSSLTARKSNGGATAGTRKLSPSSSGRTSTRREEALELERQRAEDGQRLEDAEGRILLLENDLRAAEREVTNLRQMHAAEQHRADSFEKQIADALAASQKAETLRARAASAMETMNERNNHLEREVEFLRKELSQARTYMARYGGIGKDFQNATATLGSDTVTDSNTREFFEASDYFQQATRKMATGESGTEDEVSAIVNFVLGGASASDKKQLVNAHQTDPNRLFLGEKDPYGAGKLGQIALLNSLKIEVLDLRKVLNDRDTTIEGLNDAMLKLSAEVARSTQDARNSDQKLTDHLHRHECDKVLLADAQGEVEYLRLLTGEQNETIGRLTDEHHKLSVEVRHELDLRAALEAQRDQLSDQLASVMSECDTLSQKVHGDLTTQIAMLEKTLKELTDDHLAKCGALEEMQRQHDMVASRKAELEDIIEQRLNHLGDTLQSMLARSSEIARGEEAQLRDALALLGDIRRDTAVANATEKAVASVRVFGPPIASGTGPAHGAAHANHCCNYPTSASPHQDGVARPHQLGRSAHSSSFPAAAHGGVHNASAASCGCAASNCQIHTVTPTINDLTLSNKGLSPKRKATASAPPSAVSGSCSHMHAHVHAAPVECTTRTNAAPPPSNSNVDHSDDNLPPNNTFLQQIRAEKRQHQQQNQQQYHVCQNPASCRQCCSPLLSAASRFAPFASVGSLHQHDPTTAATATTSASLIREAYAQSRIAAQHALARYERESAAHNERESAAALLQQIEDGNLEGVMAKFDADEAYWRAKLAQMEMEAAAVAAAGAAEVATKNEERKETIVGKENKQNDGSSLSPSVLLTESRPTQLVSVSAGGGGRAAPLSSLPSSSSGNNNNNAPATTITGQESVITTGGSSQAVVTASSPPLAGAVSVTTGAGLPTATATTTSATANGTVVPNSSNNTGSSSAWGLGPMAALRIAQLAARGHHHHDDNEEGKKPAVGDVQTKVESTGGKKNMSVEATASTTRPAITSTVGLPNTNVGSPLALPPALGEESGGGSAWGLGPSAALRIAQLAAGTASHPRHHNEVQQPSTAATFASASAPAATITSGAPSATLGTTTSSVRADNVVGNNNTDVATVLTSSNTTRINHSNSGALSTTTAAATGAATMGGGVANPSASELTQALPLPLPPASAAGGGSAWGLGSLATLRIAALAAKGHHLSSPESVGVIANSTSNLTVLPTTSASSVLTVPGPAAATLPSPPPSSTTAPATSQQPQPQQPQPQQVAAHPTSTVSSSSTVAVAAGSQQQPTSTGKNNGQNITVAGQMPTPLPTAAPTNVAALQSGPQVNVANNGASGTATARDGGAAGRTQLFRVVRN